MPVISLADVKNAVIQADTRRTNRQDGGFSINVNQTQVNVIYGTQTSGNRTLMNYGLPNLWTMARADIPALKLWWEARHPNTGTLLDEQQAVPGVNKVNLQWLSTNDNLFNMHVPVA